MKIKPMCVKHEGRVQRDPPFNDGGLDAYKWLNLNTLSVYNDQVQAVRLYPKIK